MDNKIKRALYCLKDAKNDNEKFAALLMVSKVTQSEKISAAHRKQIFDAIGFKFLKRLMKTESVASDCTKWTYKVVAVTILSSFASDPQLVLDKEMLSLLPQFNLIISSIPQDCEEEERQLLSDSYECLTAMASHQAGIDALVQRHTVTALCHSVTKQCHAWQKAHQLLMYLTNMAGVETWRPNLPGLHTLLTHYVTLFSHSQDEEKFGYCRTLFILLSSIDAELLDGEDCSKWANSAFSTLATVLQSKLGSGQREPAIRLASVLLDLLGVPWALTANEKHGARLVLLLVHLCCIEVRLTLENTDLSKVEAQGSLLVACYRLLENIICYLTDGESLLLDHKQVSQMHAAMVGAFTAVTYFLGVTQHGPPSQRRSPVTIATVRVLGAWIAEETSALRNDVIGVLPFLVQTCVLTSGCGCDAAKAAVKAMEEEEEEELEDVVPFLAPGLCHLSADDIARKTLIGCSGHRLLTSYVTSRHALLRQSLEAGAVNKETQVCLTTLCGVLLNLVYMEAELVKTDPAFQHLLRFIMAAVPAAAREREGGHVVLTYNLLTLGLAILRHRGSNSDFPADDVNAFLSSAVTLLWCHRLSENKMAATDTQGCKNKIAAAGSAESESATTNTAQCSNESNIKCDTESAKNTCEAGTAMKTSTLGESVEKSSERTVPLNTSDSLQSATMERTDSDSACTVVSVDTHEVKCSDSAIGCDNGHTASDNKSGVEPCSLDSQPSVSGCKQKTTVLISKSTKDSTYSGGDLTTTESPSGGRKGKLELKDTVQPVWGEVAELWALAMQAFCELVPVWGEAERLVLRSGVIPAVISALLHSKDVPSAILEGYSHLLQVLAKANGGAAKAVIKEKQGQQLAQMYNMRALAEALD